MSLSEILRTWLLEPVQKELKHMSQNMQDLQDAITAQGAKIDELGTVLTDLLADQKAAFEALKAQLAAGSDTSASVAALGGSIAKLDAAITSIKSADLDAEAAISSGTPTPQP